MPDLSVEVDDLEAALARFEEANVPIEKHDGFNSCD